MSKLIKNTSFYTIGNILPKIGSFLLIPIYTRYLDPSEYGIVYSLQVLISVLTIAFTLSLPKAIFRLFYEYKDPGEKQIFISSIFNTIFFVSLFLFLLLIIFHNITSSIYKNIDFFPYFFYLLVFILFNSFETVPKTLLQVQEKASLFVLLNLFQFSLKNGFIIVFVVYRHQGAEGYLLGQMFSAILMTPVFLFLIKGYIRLRWDFHIIKKTLAFSLPMIPGALAAWVLNLSDRIFIERYFSTSEVGVYSLGYQVAGLVLVLSGAMKTALDPHFYKISNENDYQTARPRLSKDFNYFIIAIFLVSFLIALFSKDLILLFIQCEYHEAYKIVPIISLAYLISHFSGYYNLMIYQKMKSNVVMIITLLGAILNIALNVILIPKFGIYGAGWATVVSFALIFILSKQISKKYYHIPLNIKLITSLIIFGAAIIIPLNYYLNIDPMFSLIIKTACIATIFLIVFLRYKVTFLSVFSK